MANFRYRSRTTGAWADVPTYAIHGTYEGTVELQYPQSMEYDSTGKPCSGVGQYGVIVRSRLMTGSGINFWQDHFDDSTCTTASICLTAFDPRSGSSGSGAWTSVSGWMARPTWGKVQLSGGGTDLGRMLFHDVKIGIHNCSLSGAHYYVDNTLGNDSNIGTSITAPWKTLGKVNSYTGFIAGDNVLFKKGETWVGAETDALQITDRGLIVSNYGSGNLPIISNPGAGLRTCVMVTADSVTINGLRFEDATLTAVQVGTDTVSRTGCMISYCEMDGCGSGAEIYGDNHTFTYNAVTDPVMVVNTEGGDDDYGAVGVWLEKASNCTVTHNTFTNCLAASYDYGVDGGAVEFFGTSSGHLVAWNYAIGCRGFLEIGGSDSFGRTCENCIVAYNVSINSDTILHVNLSPYQYYVTVTNLQLLNNTIASDEAWLTAMNFISNELTGDQLIFRNNILDDNYQTLARKLVGATETKVAGFTHQYNLYGDGSTALEGLGLTQSMTLGIGELEADAKFTNRTTYDLTLAQDSPAVNAGYKHGLFTEDYAGKAISGNPDMGAYEGTGSVPDKPTNLSTSVNGVLTYLSWTDNSTTEIGYRIQRSLDDTTWTTVRTLPANSTWTRDALWSYPDSPVIYRVCAYNGYGNSGYAYARTTTGAVQSTLDAVIEEGADDGLAVTWGYGEIYPAVESERIGNDGVDDYSMWLRFYVAIPAGATISTAYLTLYGVYTYARDTHMVISALDTATPDRLLESYEVVYDEYMAAARTTATVAWDITSTTENGAVQSPELSSIIQEMVNSYDYSGWLYLMVAVDESSSTNETWVWHQNGGPDTQPTLHIEW